MQRQQLRLRRIEHMLWIIMAKVITATQFKVHCLAILDEVWSTGRAVTITKRGRPVAQLVAPPSRRRRYPQDGLEGTVRVIGDIDAPALSLERGDVDQ